MHFRRGGVSDYYIYTAGSKAWSYARVCVRSFCPRLSVCVYIACVYTVAKAQARQGIRKSRVAFLYVTTQANVSIFRWRHRCYRHHRCRRFEVRRARHIIFIVMLYRPMAVVVSYLPCGGHHCQILYNMMMVTHPTNDTCYACMCSAAL